MSLIACAHRTLLCLTLSCSLAGCCEHLWRQRRPVGLQGTANSSAAHAEVHERQSIHLLKGEADTMHTIEQVHL